MKTWEHVARRIERNRLPYRVQDGALATLEGRAVARSVQGARDVLSGPGHPESKRQARRNQRDLERYGARVLKESRVTSCRLRRISKQREIEINVQLAKMDDLIRSRLVAARLMGKTWTSVPGGISDV